MKTINIKGELLNLSTPLVMGILNVTPDSFYEGSRKQSEAEIIRRVQQIIDEGGRIVDIGAQSSNPKSEFLSPQTEIERLDFALKIINKHFPDLIMSVDTFYADVARFSVEEHGVAIINDISGGSLDDKMFETVATLNVPYILMHMRGTPQTMQQYVDYGNFIQVLVDFIIIGVSIFFVIKGINKMKRKKEAEPTPEPAPTPTKEETLLTEIRDLLKKN